MVNLPTSSIPTLSTSTKWELTKWEVDKVGINRYNTSYNASISPDSPCRSLVASASAVGVGDWSNQLDLVSFFPSIFSGIMKRRSGMA